MLTSLDFAEGVVSVKSQADQGRTWSAGGWRLGQGSPTHFLPAHGRVTQLPQANGRALRATGTAWGAEMVTQAGHRPALPSTTSPGQVPCVPAKQSLHVPRSPSNPAPLPPCCPLQGADSPGTPLPNSGEVGPHMPTSACPPVEKGPSLNGPFGILGSVNYPSCACLTSPLASGPWGRTVSWSIWTPTMGTQGLGGHTVGVGVGSRASSPLEPPRFRWWFSHSSCPTLCDPMDCSPPGSSVHGILQARVLEWVAMSFSRGSSRPRDQTQVSCLAGRFFTDWAKTDIWIHPSPPLTAWKTLGKSVSYRESVCQMCSVYAHSLQSCLIPCDPIDCSLPGSSVHGILQARVLEWVAMPSSRGSSRPRDWTWVSCVSCMAG